MVNSKTRKIRDVVRNFLKENYLYWSEDIEIENNQSLLEEGIVDSTGILELAAFLESTFLITINDEEFIPENLDTLNAISTYVLRKTNGSSQD
jgi:acyl carrier protein